VASLSNSGQGTYRPITDTDLSGNVFQPDPLTHRRYSVLDATQANSDQVTDETKAREDVLQADIAATLAQLATASTDAEAQKLTAKLIVLNGQLSQVEATQKREVDAVEVQKIANDSRKEEEMQAAAELEMQDDYLANQRVSAYMQTIKLRTTTP
jgi:hypothetical protein